MSALTVDVAMSLETAEHLVQVAPCRLVTTLPVSGDVVLRLDTWGFQDADAVVADLRAKAGDDIHQVLDVESTELP